MSKIIAACSICQECFGLSSVMSVMSCGHVFHGGCIDRWIEGRPSCPVCRSEGGVTVKKVFWDEPQGGINTSMDMGCVGDYYEVRRLEKELQTASEVSKATTEKIKALETALTTANNKLYVTEMNQDHMTQDKNEELAKATRKIHALRFIDDIVNKSQEKVDQKLKKIMSSDNILEEINNVCFGIVILKKDLEFYKDKSAGLSKDLSRAEMKNRILESKLESHKEFGNDLENVFLTPTKCKPPSGLTRLFTTPQLLLMPSPDTPTSIQKRRIHEDIIAANPFTRNAIDVKKKRFDLSSLNIMRGKPQHWSKKE